MRCPSCDFSNEASAEACSQCGTPLSRELRTAESIELEEVTVQFDDDIGFSAGATIEPAGEVQPPDDSDTAEPSASSEEKAPPPPKEEEIGDLIGDRYEIISQLGRGGMGAVFLARDNKPGLGGRQVAIKRVLKASERGIQRFLRESETIAQLNHQNIRAIYDRGEDEVGHFLVMEYVEGESLHDLVARDGVLKDDDFGNIVRGLARSLAFAHRKGVIHRDVKPANVMLTEDGTPKLTDFGLARASEDSELSMEGYGMGTAGYAAPEQRRDASSVDHRADIYGLGATMYFLLTGRSPKTIRESRVPERWRRITLRCLEERPEDRYYSVDDFLDDLAAGASSQSSLLRQVPAGAELFDCPACSTSNAEAAQYCRSCGGGLFEACPKCNQMDRAGARFCSGCGTDTANWKLSEECFSAARHHRESHELVAAIKEAQEALKTVPDRGDIRTFLEEVKAEYSETESARDVARAATEEKDFDLAEQSWREVLAILPKDEEALQAIAGLKERTRSVEFSERHSVLLRSVSQGDWRSSVRILRTLRAWAGDEDQGKLQEAEKAVRGLQLARVKDLLQRAEDEADEGDYEEAYQLLEQARKGGATEKTVEPIRKKFKSMEIEGTRLARARKRKVRFRKLAIVILVLASGGWFGGNQIYQRNQSVFNEAVQHFLEAKGSENDWSKVTEKLKGWWPQPWVLQDWVPVKYLPEDWSDPAHIKLKKMAEKMKDRPTGLPLDEEEWEELGRLRERCSENGENADIQKCQERALGILQDEAEERLDLDEPLSLKPDIEGLAGVPAPFRSLSDCKDVSGKTIVIAPDENGEGTKLDLHLWMNDDGEKTICFVDKAGFEEKLTAFVFWDRELPKPRPIPEEKLPLRAGEEVNFEISDPKKQLAKFIPLTVKNGALASEVSSEGGKLHFKIKVDPLKVGETKGTLELAGTVQDDLGNQSDFKWKWETRAPELARSKELFAKRDYRGAMKILDLSHYSTIPPEIRTHLFDVCEKWFLDLEEKTSGAPAEGYYELIQDTEQILENLAYISSTHPEAEALQGKLEKHAHDLAVKNAKYRFGSKVAQWRNSWGPKEKKDELHPSLGKLEPLEGTQWAPTILGDLSSKRLPVKVFLESPEFPFHLVPEGELTIEGETATLSPFYISETELSRKDIGFFRIDVGDVGDGGVSWWTADKWCKNQNLSLPTEAQWVYAALGAQPHEKQYPWGTENEMGHANVKVPGQAGGLKGKYAYPHGASWCGALNMSGRFWEWCADGNPGQSPSDFLEGRDPVVPPKEGHVYRGGSFDAELGAVLARGMRRHWASGEVIEEIGFRPLRVVDLRGPSLGSVYQVTVPGKYRENERMQTSALDFGERIEVLPGRDEEFRVHGIQKSVQFLSFIVPKRDSPDLKLHTVTAVVLDKFKNPSEISISFKSWSIEAKIEDALIKLDKTIAGLSEEAGVNAEFKSWRNKVDVDNKNKLFGDVEQFNAMIQEAEGNRDARIDKILRADRQSNQGNEEKKHQRKLLTDMWNEEIALWRQDNLDQPGRSVLPEYADDFEKLDNQTVYRQLERQGGRILKRLKHRESNLTFFWIPKKDNQGGFYISESKVSVTNKVLLYDDALSWCERRGLTLPGKDDWEFAAYGPEGMGKTLKNLETYPTNFEYWAGGLGWLEGPPEWIKTPWRGNDFFVLGGVGREKEQKVEKTEPYRFRAIYSHKGK